MYGGDEVKRYARTYHHAIARAMLTTSPTADALDLPFFFLPFRPHSDPSGARSFIANYFSSNAAGSNQYKGASLQRELRLTEVVVLCSILKWCWSRMPGGVVSWPVYDGFQIGEKEANMARNAFETFIPISADSPARQRIIFDFYDLLASIAAHGKLNGFGGRKLSRLAGWWAFEHADDGKGFEGGYRSWAAAADASSHLFFAYLRTLSPEEHPSMSLIERIPRALQALLASTEYPPETPTLLQKSTPRVVMVVDSVSPTPFALLRRARNFEYRSSDRVLREYQEFQDPVDALTDECKRVLNAISSINSSAAKSRHQNVTRPAEAWTSFQNMGFGDWEDGTAQTGSNGIGSPGSPPSSPTLQSAHKPRDLGRPTTPSWAEFMSVGFAEDDLSKPSATYLLPPDKQLPPLGSRAQSPTYIPHDRDVAPGELAAINNVELDDAFWWVWMTSLAGEEPAQRKAVFGRCAVIETSIMRGAWLIMEEQVKGASPDPVEGAYIAKSKRSIFSFSKRGKLNRKESTNKLMPPLSPVPPAQSLASPTPSRRSLAPDQQSKIKEAAAALKKQESKDEELATRRGRHGEASQKTNSVLTMGLQSAAGPAMKWTTAYDRSAIRAQYLGNRFAGTGVSRENLTLPSDPADLEGYLNNSSTVQREASVPPPEPSNILTSDLGRELPALPSEEPAPPPAGEVEVPTVPLAPVPEPVSPGLHEDMEEHGSADSDKEIVPEEAPVQRVTTLDQEVANAGSLELKRKPVPRSSDGPRPGSVEKPVVATSPAMNPAALAAQRAMVSTTSSPESPQDSFNPRFQKQGGGSALRKFFGRKKEQSGRPSVEGARVGAGLAPPSESTFGRKLSLMRKKPTTTAALPVQPSKPSPMETMHPNASELEAEPVAIPPHTSASYPNSDSNVSQADSVQDANPEHEFARFDQGPPDTPLHSHPVASAPGIIAAPQAQRQFNVNEHLATKANEHDRLVQYGQHEHDGDDEHDDLQSEATMEEHQANAVIDSKDRWATIRENAARRAAQRASEERSSQSRPSAGARTEDDGETSGEESKSHQLSILLL